MVTIVPEMLTFRTSTPENFDIKELENGIIYIDREVIVNEEEEEPPPPPPEPEEELAIPEPEQYKPEVREPSKSIPPRDITRQPSYPPPPSDYSPKEKSRKKKRRLFGKLKKRISR